MDTAENGYESVFRKDLFAGKRIVVTGGGSGIGRCTAHELASLGANVIVTGRKTDKLQRVVDEIHEDGGSATFYAFDIRDEDAVVSNIETMVAAGTPITGLVNCAGGQYPSPLEKISTKGFDTVLKTNVVGAFTMSRELVNQSMKNTGGAIVNITADFWNGMPTMGHSGAARAACDNFTKTAAVEWGRFGIRTNSIAPGWVASSGFDTYEDPGIKALLPQLKTFVPLARIATEAEISSTICFLLSDGAAFVSGASLRVDGGASLSSAFFPPQPASNSESYQGFHRYRAPKAIREDG